MNDAHQLLSDCPNCRTESAVVELLDPSIAEGVSVEARCRLCGRQEELGVLIFAGRSFERAEDAYRALSEWAAEDGSDSVEDFCRANLGGLGLEEVSQRLLAGEVIGTNFDVVAYLFPSLGGGRGSRTLRSPERVTRGRQLSTSSDGRVDDASVQGTAVSPEDGTDSIVSIDDSPQPVMARALAAVMVADSRIRLEELRYLSRTLEAHGLHALLDEDIRPWRPADLAEPDEPRVVIRAMVGLAYIDRHRDRTEWRVIREFARHWRVPSSEVEAMSVGHEERGAGQLALLWRGLRSLFVLEA